jgi:hypothetical protein
VRLNPFNFLTRININLGAGVTSFAVYPAMTLWKNSSSGMPFFFRPKHYFGALKSRYQYSHAINRAFRWVLPASALAGYWFANTYTDAEDLAKKDELMTFGKIKLAY